MSTRQTLTLNDGRQMPQLGLGVWKATPAQAKASVEAALGLGYRHVDTAAIYANEAGVGAGLRASGVPREDVFITTKVWNDDQGFDATLAAFDASLKRLKLEYVDLYLIHWPAPSRGLYLDTWRALLRLRDEGRARSIGVSNFEAAHLEHLIAETGVTPAVNQVEVHPRFQQRPLRALHEKLGIVTCAWSPLGQGTLPTHPTVEAIARARGRSGAQVLLRWHLQRGLAAIPKSVTPSRIAENFDVFSFSLGDDELARLDALDDDDGRIGPHPLRMG